VLTAAGFYNLSLYFLRVVRQRLQALAQRVMNRATACSVSPVGQRPVLKTNQSSPARRPRPAPHREVTTAPGSRQRLRAGVLAVSCDRMRSIAEPMDAA
jgi:hypothetical protein